MAVATDSWLAFVEAQTYRAQAQRIIEHARVQGLNVYDLALMLHLGWCAAGQKGEPSVNLVTSGFFRHSTAETITGKLLEAYATGYHFGQETALLVEQAAPVTISKHGLENYQQDLRRPVGALWRGDITRAAFLSTMVSVLDRGLTRAWLEGIAEFGFSRDDLTDQEIVELQLQIARQLEHIDPLAEDIERSAKVKGGKLSPFLTRVTTAWGNRYEELRNAGRVIAGKDQKAMWVLGIAEYCVSCLKLAGKVRRFSWWRENNILPRVAGAPYLECKGYK